MKVLIEKLPGRQFRIMTLILIKLFLKIEVKNNHSELILKTISIIMEKLIILLLFLMF